MGISKPNTELGWDQWDSEKCNTEIEPADTHNHQRSWLPDILFILPAIWPFSILEMSGPFWVLKTCSITEL